MQKRNDSDSVFKQVLSKYAFTSQKKLKLFVDFLPALSTKEKGYAKLFR